MRRLKGQIVTPGFHVGPAYWFVPGREVPGDAVVLVKGAANAEAVLGLRHAAAVASSAGGKSSHSSILMRQFDVPCLVAVEGLEAVPHGANVELDAHSGVLRLLP